MSKGLEALQDIKNWFEITDNMEETNIIEKELKAFEIIKRVYTDLCFILSFDTFEEYNRSCELISVEVNLKRVNREEFDLLKEVL